MGPAAAAASHEKRVRASRKQRRTMRGGRPLSRRDRIGPRPDRKTRRPAPWNDAVSPADFESLPGRVVLLAAAGSERPIAPLGHAAAGPPEHVDADAAKALGP
eukprot:1162451-Pyramimonas_sp.AAC.1